MPGLQAGSLVGGHVRGNHTLMFLSLSFSLPLSKNKLNLKKKIEHLRAVGQHAHMRSRIDVVAVSIDEYVLSHLPCPLCVE